MGTDTQERTIVYLGNREAVQVIDDPSDTDYERDGRAPAKLREELPGKRCTTITLAPGTTLMQAAVEITDPSHGVWQAHSNAASPAWVASTDQVLAELLASHWGCEVRQPDPEHAASGEAVDPGEEG